MVLITADVSENIKARKQALEATWTIIILRGIQSLENKDTAAQEALFKENEQIKAKLNRLALQIYQLEENQNE
jgi:hypothetical protein